MSSKSKALTLAAAGAAAWLTLRAWRSWKAYDLRDKNVLITGGSRGLGLVLARQLVAEGARVAICARDPAELERAELDLRQRGGHVVARRCDLTDQGQVTDMVNAVRVGLGPVDVLINNAGTIAVGPIE